MLASPGVLLWALHNNEKTDNDNGESIIPSHVTSVKILDDHKKLSFINNSEPNPTTSQIIQSAEGHSSQGVKHSSVHSPEHKLWDDSRALHDLQALMEEAVKEEDPDSKFYSTEEDYEFYH
jgi:hypothetical protein